VALGDRSNIHEGEYRLCLEKLHPAPSAP
jgi:hypothetical protein